MIKLGDYIYGIREDTTYCRPFKVHSIQSDIETHTLIYRAINGRTIRETEYQSIRKYVSDTVDTYSFASSHTSFQVGDIVRLRTRDELIEEFGYNIAYSIGTDLRKDDLFVIHSTTILEDTHVYISNRMDNSHSKSLHRKAIFKIHKKTPKKHTKELKRPSSIRKIERNK